MSQAISGKITHRDIHPVCELVPESTPAEFAALLEDVRANGFREPIILAADGRIVDGRTRYRVGHELSIEPPHRTLPADTLLAPVVLSYTLTRKNLTNDQRSCAGAKLTDYLKVERAERERHGRTQDIERGEKTSDYAARICNATSGSSVERAAQLAKADPVLFQRVLSGEAKLATALRKATGKTKPQYVPKDEALDELGNHLSAELVPIFAARAVYAELRHNLRELHSTIQHLYRTQAGAYLYLEHASIDASILAVLNELEEAAPYALCPTCLGDRCDNCQRTGFVGKRRHKRLTAAQKAKE